MAVELFSDRGQRGLRILDPAVGPGTFPVALGSTGKLRGSDEIFGFDIDREMLAYARATTVNLRCRTELIEQDYLLSTPTEPYDCAILNPPYVRQEWLDSKELYRQSLKSSFGLTIPGTANLYVFFVVKALHELRAGGRFVCLLYDSWQMTRFGRWLVDVLEESCGDLKILSVPRQPFKGRMIDATILCGRRASACSPRRPLLPPKRELLSNIDGLARISDQFRTVRGLRLKQSGFFLSSAETAPIGATPFVKKLLGHQSFEVPPDHPQRALIVAPGENRPSVLAELRRRLTVALLSPSEHMSVLNWYRERPDSWFHHRHAPSAPFLINYYLRGKPRHVFSNGQHGFADNFYGATPKEDCDLKAVLAVLNSTVARIGLLEKARNQGGGLAKLQLFEYREALVPDWKRFTHRALHRLSQCGSRLLESPKESTVVLQRIDAIVASELSDPRLSRENLEDLLQAADSAARRPHASANGLA